MGICVIHTLILEVDNRIGLTYGNSIMTQQQNASCLCLVTLQANLAQYFETSLAYHIINLKIAVM
jgi:hypothetical protein